MADQSVVVWGILTELIILALITYIPMGDDIFGTSTLPAWIFGSFPVGVIVLLFVEESCKFIMNRFNQSHAGGVMQ